MQVDSSNSQQNVVTPVTADQNGGQSTKGVQTQARPAVYDTSAAGNTQQLDSGGAGSDQVQKGPPPADLNAKTYWHLGPNGEHVYDGHSPAPNPHPENAGHETPWNVFGRGVKDGATHPGQTIGKIVDIKKGDGTHNGEENGKQADEILTKLPVVGSAINITKVMTGTPEPDGTQTVPEAPNVQPDAGEAITTRPGDKAPAPPASEAPTAKPGKQTTPATAKPGEQTTPATAKPGEQTSPATAKPGEQTSPATAKPGEQTSPATAKPGEQHASASSSNFDAVPKENAVKPSGNLEADPNNPGVFRDEKGQAYIQAADKDWPVTYDKDNGTWRVYDPADASKPQQPVQLDQQGNWQTHDNVGLKGGNPGDTAAGGSNANNRERLNTETQNSPTGNQPGSYTNSVNAVNGLLQRLGINLSDQSAETIINNVHHVDAGELSHAGASAREAWTFARDVADPHLPMKDRYAAAFGMVLNGIVSPAYHAEFDLENYHFGRNQTQDLRQAMQRFIQNDPHS